MVIVKPTLVKELTKKRKKNECYNLIFSFPCDISERDKRYMTKYANNE